MRPTHCLLLVLTIACQPKIANPTGQCTASSDGSRAGYHGANGDQWLPHCQTPLKREYWRVFATDNKTAYTIPRMDGDPLLSPACGNPKHGLHALVQQYRLCQPATDAQTTSIINAMLPADALVLTFFLHSQLRFRASEGKGGSGVSPYAIPSDVIDACKLKQGTQSSALVAVCKIVRSTVASGFDKGISYGSAAPELADRLNELYGVEAP